jgi:GDP-L-fucose synthase
MEAYKLQIKKASLEKTTKIYIAGHKGMVGSAVWRALVSRGYSN